MTATTSEAQCEPLGDPIEYTTKKPTGPRHAGPELAPRLAEQNLTGQRLDCPKFKKAPQ